MKMTFGTVIAGSILIVMTAVFMTVGLSALTFKPAPSDIARPLSEAEERGRQVYMSNGCVYCHTQYVRPQDWNAAGGGKASRVAQAGDYVFQKTMLLGTERTGPDLSQEGGIHPDSWHYAHFQNPRYTSPNSVMPQFSYVRGQDLEDLIAYIQGLGGKAADARYNQVKETQTEVLKAWDAGYEAHLKQIKEMVPETWRELKSAMPPTERSLLHGKQVYITNCIGCHGINGDGRGPASGPQANGGNRGGMKPDPANFQNAQLQLAASDGQFYQYLLFGLPGTAMPAWGDYLTVNDIWDVINFLRTIPNGGLQRDPKPDMMLQFDARYGAKVPGGYTGPEPSKSDQILDNPKCALPASPTRPKDCDQPTGSK